MHRQVRTLLALTLAFLVLGPTWAATEVEWALFDGDCDGETWHTPLSCGRLGTFQFGSEASRLPCSLKEFGEERFQAYPEPATTQRPFPEDPTLFSDLLESWQGLLDPGHSYEIPSDEAPAPPEENVPDNWVALIDFSGFHGASTWQMINSILPRSAAAGLQLVDDPILLESFGSQPSDVHLLAALCTVLDKVDSEEAPAPLALNMSLGRLATQEDAMDEANCPPSLLTCQIARVLEQFSGYGTHIMAANGNHQSPLFPAALGNVIGVGALGTDQYLKQESITPRWETPRGCSNALAPGTAHCVSGEAVAGGTSYSSAMMSGWVAVKVLAGEFPSNMQGGVWLPRFDHDAGCHLLTRGDRVYPGCVPAIDAIFEGLNGGYESVCWGSANEITAEPIPTGSLQDQPNVPSYDELFATSPHPTPESDPCLPCGGKGDGLNLVVDTSQAQPIDASLELHSVYLRLDADYYPMLLTSAELADVAGGNMPQLVFAGLHQDFYASFQASVYYVVRPAGSALNCGVEPGCHWTSAPILKLQP